MALARGNTGICNFQLFTWVEPGKNTYGKSHSQLPTPPTFPAEKGTPHWGAPFSLPVRSHRPLYHLTSEVKMAFPFPLKNAYGFKLFSPFQFLLVGVLRGKGFPDSSVVKNSPANTGDLGLIPGLGRSLGWGNGHWLQYSCLKNPRDGGAWQTTVCGVTRKQTQLQSMS